MEMRRGGLHARLPPRQPTPAKPGAASTKVTVSALAHGGVGVGQCQDDPSLVTNTF